MFSFALWAPNACGEQRPTLDERGVDPKNLSGGPSAPVACSVVLWLCLHVWIRQELRINRY
jgi:hypothetical protein